MSHGSRLCSNCAFRGAKRVAYYGIGRIYGNEDRQIMSEAVDVVPYKMDAASMTLAHRPRLYWCDWELPEMEGVHIHLCPQAQFGDFHVVQLEAELNAADFLELGGLCKMSSSSSCPLSLRHGLHRSREEARGVNLL